MPSAVEKFLAQKRAAQQGSLSPQINSVAPPIHERYGIKPMSGEYTGKGSDGITQPMMPTQRRMDSNGTPYVVDENELLVTDSKTLGDYGGPEALDKFIQANRPGRQFTCGGVPARQRYYTGGIPANRAMQTRPRAISSDQMRMLGEVRDGVKRFQDGGISTEEPKERILPTPNTIPIQNPDPIPDTNVTPDNITIPVQNITPFGDVQGLTPQNITMPDLSQKIPTNKTQGLIGQNITMPDFAQGLTTNNGIGGTTGPKAYSPKDIDEMMYQRELARMGSAQESERAAEAQRGMQGGLSDREVQGRGAISDVGRREAQAGATADFAINQQNKMQEQDQFNQQMQQQQKQFDVEQDKWNKTFDTQKQKDSLNTMLAAGDYKGASKMFSDIYGQSIDFSSLENEKKAGKFNEGFNNMTGLIASGTKWEDAVKIMQADGSFEKMGMTEYDLQKFYEQAQLNNDPLYKAMSWAENAVKNKLISQDQADDFIAVLQYTLTNPQGLTVSDGWSVKDKNGKEAGFFTTEAEADAYLKANPGFTKGTFEKNHVSVGGGGSNGNSGNGDGTFKYSDYVKAAEQDNSPYIMTESEFKKSGYTEYKNDSDAFADFEASISDPNSKITVSDWIKAGRPISYNLYQKNLGESNPEFAKEWYEKYKGGTEWKDFVGNKYVDKKVAKEMLISGREKLISNPNNTKAYNTVKDIYAIPEKEVKDVLKSGDVVFVKEVGFPATIYYAPGGAGPYLMSLIDGVVYEYHKDGTWDKAFT